MDSSEFEFDTTTRTSFTWTFDLSSGVVIPENSMLLLHLPGFGTVPSLTKDFASSSMFGHLEDPSHVLDELKSFFNETSELMKLYVNRTIFDDEEIIITANGITPPVGGIAPDSTSIHYAVAYGHSTEATTNWIPFISVTEYITIFNSSLEFEFHPNSIKHLKALTMVIDMTNGFSTGDIIFLPNLGTAIEVKGQHDDGNISLVCSYVAGGVSSSDCADVVNGTWWGEESTLIMKFLSSTSTTVEITFNVSTEGFYLADTGISANTPFDIVVYDSNFNYIANHTEFLPCVGVCKVDIKPAASSPGRATAYDLDVRWRGFGMLPNDALTVYLSDFTGVAQNKVKHKNISCSDPVGSDAGIFGFSLIAEGNSTILNIVYLSQRNFTSEVFALKCLIPQDFNLVLPKDGIRSGETFIANMTYHLDGAIDYFAPDVVKFPNVGSALLSTINIAPGIPNSDVSLEFIFSFKDKLQKGDVIQIYLPNFVAPSRPLPFTMMHSEDDANSDDLLSISVASTSSVVTERRNVDNSVYFDRMISYLTVTVHEEFSPGRQLSFALENSVGIKSPVEGVFTRPLPWFSVISATSPIAGITFSNVTRFGTLNPSKYGLKEYNGLKLRTSTNESLSVLLLDLEFTASCPMFQNDSILVRVPQISEMNVTYDNLDVKLKTWNTSSTSALAVSSFNVSYLAANESVQIKLEKGYILSGKLTFQILLLGFEFTTEIVYQDDSRITYDLISDTCPVNGGLFSSTGSHLVKSANAKILPVDSLNGNNVVSVDIVPVVPLLVNDLLVVLLENVTYNSSFTGQCTFAELCLIPLQTSIPSYAFPRSVYLNVSARSVMFIMVVQHNIASLTNLHFSTYSNSTDGFVFVNDATNPMIEVQVAALRGEDSETVFSGPILDIETIPFLTAVAVDIENPVVGKNSTMIFSWTMSSALSSANSMEFVLPGFTLYPKSPNTWSFSSVDAVQQFYVTFFEDNSTLSLKPKIPIPGKTAISVTVPALNGVVIGAEGLPYRGKGISVLLLNNGKKIFQRDVETYTVVPFVSTSEISFLSSDASHAFVYGGNVHALQLEPGHELNVGDGGELIIIDGDLYTIDYYEANVLYLVEEYRGRRVFLGSPNIVVESSPYRYATYLSGSNTDHLFFRYKVARGDLGYGLALYSQSQNSKYLIELNNGKLLRASQSPVVVASLSLPAILSGDRRYIDTYTPIITEIYTTSAQGVYGEGQYVDIIVKFSEEVVVYPPIEQAQPPGRILLNLESSGIQYAEYYNGSGTTDIVFLYKVKSYDNEVNITRNMITEKEADQNETSYDLPFYQPLRFIVGSQFGYLRRKSDIPLLDADLNLANATFSFQANPQFVGEAPIVSSLKLFRNKDKIGYGEELSNYMNSKVYSAGDYIQFAVEFTAPVEVTIPDDNSTRPYIELDVGRQLPGVAYFERPLDRSTLLFSYMLTIDDELPHGLLLFCTCADYLRRSFIHLNGSTISGRDNGITASLQIAPSWDLASLQIDGEVELVKDVPRVLSVNSNVTTGIYAPGDAILVNVHYSAPVYVLGIVTLQLQGQSSFCRAPFYDGNGTDSLNFVYHVSGRSGVGKLDCSSASGLDTTLGTVFRNTDVPTIKANNSLPLPGSQIALGRQEYIIIDTNDGHVKDIQIELHRSDTTNQSIVDHVNIMAAQGLSFNYIQGMTLDELYSICGCEAWLDDENLSPSKLEEMVSARSDILTALNVSSVSELPDYLRFTVVERYFQSIDTLPTELARCFNWWKSYLVEKHIDLLIDFNRPVVQEGIFVKLNTATMMNQARSLSSYKHYTLIAVQPATTMVYDENGDLHDWGSLDRFFALRYNGQISPCISLTKNIHGDNSFLNDILEITQLQPFLPTVSKTYGDTGTVQFDIDFIKALDYPLELLFGEAISTICQYPANGNSISMVSKSSQMTLRYDIQHEDSLILTSKERIPAGEYSIAVRGPKLSNFQEVLQDSFVVKHLSPGQIIRSYSTAANNPIARITRSSLIFGSNYPGNTSEVHVEICVSTKFGPGDTITVHLPYFNERTSSMNTPSTSDFSAEWDNGNSELIFTVLGTSSGITCLKTPSGLNAYNLTLPSRAIYRNDRTFSFSTNSTSVGNLKKVTFQFVKPVGIADISLSLSNPRPYFPTNLIVHIELMMDLQPGNETMELYLPGFYSFDSLRADINIQGFLGEHINGRWWNQSSTMYFTPYRRIPAGVYDFVVESDVFSLISPPSGIDVTDPPGVVIKDPFWELGVTPMVEYPIIYGYESIHAEIAVNSSYSLTSLVVEIVVSRTIKGPAMFAVTIPSLTHKFGYFASYNDSELFDEAIWYDFNKTWVIKRNAGWEYTGVALSFTMKNVTNFYVNERGINTHTGPDNETTIALYATDGYLPPIPFNFDVGVPIITNAEVQLINLQQDIFYSGKEKMMVSFDVNRPPQIGDSFYVKLEGGLKMNFSQAISDDYCFDLLGFSASSNETVLEIGMSNASWIYCKYQLMYHLEFSISNIAVDLNSKIIRQYEFPYVSIAWTNPELASDYRYVARSPWLGLYMSSLTFSNPYCGQPTGIELKLSTATTLLKGDLIQLYLEDFSCNITSSSVTSGGGSTVTQQSTINDIHGVSWLWKCSTTITSSSTSTVITLTVPLNLPASAIHFNLLNRNVLFLPTGRGISFYNHANQLKVGFQRKERLIHPQAIAVVTPVGHIDQMDVQLLRVTADCEEEICDVEFSDDFGLIISIKTLSRLSAGNSINISFESLSFQFPKILPTFEDAHGILEVRTVSSNTIKIIIFDRQYEEELSITILPSPFVGLSLGSSFSAVVSTDIDSFTSPVKQYETEFQLLLLESPTVSFVKRVNMSEEYIRDAAFDGGSVLEMTLSFTLRQSFTTGDLIEVYLPSFLNWTDGSLVPSRFVLKNDSSAGWDIDIGLNNSLIIIATQNITSISSSVGQEVLITVATDLLHLVDGLVYGDFEVEFKVVDRETNTTMDSSFFTVVPLGLSESSISFRNPVVDGISVIDIYLVPATVFNTSEVVLVNLPGFINTLGASLNATVYPDSCDLEWDSSLETLYIELNDETEIIKVALYEFQLPSEGVNNFNGSVPKISYNQTGSWFGAATFSSSQHIAPPISVNFTFGSNTAGSWSSIDLSLSSSMLFFDRNDQIEVFLPQFYSNHEQIDITSSVGRFIAKWIACEEILAIIATEAFASPVQHMDMSLSSLILPPKGVTDDIAAVLSVTSNSKVAGSQLFFVEGVERIGYVDDSKIWFSPGVINGTSQDLIVDFLLSLPIVEGDEIVLTLPGILASDSCTLVSNLSIPFDISTNLADQTITLTSRYHWNPMRWTSLNISECVMIPIEGFPTVEYSDYSFFISAALEAGYIGQTEIKQIYPVGVKSAHVHYVIPDTSQPISIQLSLEFTTTLMKGDQISIYLPYANATQDLYNLSIRGDLASENFRSHFAGRFDKETSSIFFDCIDEIPLRPFTIFVDLGVDADSSLTLSMNQNRNASHYLSSNISAMGSIIQRWIPYSPTNIGLVRDPEVNVVTCNGTLFCEFELHFTLVDDLEVDNHLIFSHEQLRLPAFTSLNFSSTSSDMSNQFDLFWRKADQQNGLSIEYHELYTESELNGRLWVSSNMQTLSVDRSLASFVDASNFNDVTLVTQVPRVKSLQIIDSYDSYFCGEELDIIITMDSAVVVFDVTKVKLLLNTGEYAVMLGLRDSNQLHFRYFVKDPRGGYVEELAVAGPGALEILSFDHVFDAENTFLAANLTLEPPFELRRPSYLTGFFETVSIVCDDTAIVERVYAYSGEKIWYSNGDVLDVNVVFNRPIVVSGQPQLVLSEMTSGQNFIAKYIEVSRVQKLHVAFSPMEFQFNLVYLGENTGCLFANDTQGIAEALKLLPTLKNSLPLHIEKLANANSEYHYILTFYGVSPQLLQVDNLWCEDRTGVRIEKDPKLANEVTFRYVVSSTDTSGNISQANSSALQLVDSSNIFVRDSFIDKQVDLTLPASSDGNSLHGSSHIWVNNDPPYVLNVTSDFNYVYGRPAKNGDNITIEVMMSAPMISNGSVLLPLEVNNVLNSSQSVVYASLMFIQGQVLTFSYYVNLGDNTELLDLAFSPNAMIIQDEAAGSYLRRYSRIPLVNASLELPYPGAANGLSISNVLINATELPIIMRSYVTPIQWKAPAGSTVIVNIEFSSNVTLTSTSLDLTPRIDFVSPAGATMYYLGGSGSTTLQFSYYVKPTHASGNVSFVFMLEHAFIEDLMGHKFSNLTDQYVVVDFLGIDTHIPTAMKVDCNCDDGIYYPGQVLDIYILFDKEVLIMNSTETLNPIELELFVYTQEDQMLLAQYAYGNGTRSLHFFYTIPEPNKFTVSAQPHRIDYAGTAALEKHLKYAYLTDASPIPTTRANVFLPILDVSYLAYSRRVLIDFHNSKVSRVFAMRNGTYTVGDKLTVVVQFTTPVMFFEPAPYLVLAMESKDEIATYVKGNDTTMLYFEYIIAEGDSTKLLDYIDSRNMPYDTSSTIRSYPLMSYDNYEAKFYDTPIAGLYMSSNVSRIPVECSFPVPGSSGSLSKTSFVKVDTSQPVVVSVQAMIPSGTYGSLTSIPILVEFNEAVVVQGCPYLIFIVNRVKRYATYVSGSGGKILYFKFTVLSDEYSLSLDYWDRYSLRIQSCSGENGATGATFINRLSDDPTLPADLTLPRPGASANSVDVGTSIISSGRNITLSGGSIRPISIKTTLLANNSYSFGDVIDVTVDFTGDFSVTDPLIALELIEFSGSSLFGNAYAVNQTSKSELRFEYLIGPYEENKHVSYNGSHAMYSVMRTSCLFIDLTTKKCMQQSLPDIGQLNATGHDYLTGKNIKVSPMTSSVMITGIRFSPSSSADNSSNSNSLLTSYLTGDRIVVELDFSDAVAVTGEPVIFLQLNDTVQHLKAQFYRQASANTLLFTYIISQGSTHGKLACGKGCMIYFEQGAIRKRNNFLSITHANVAIPDKRHCLDEPCDLIETKITKMIPFVTRVYTNSTGVITNGETISIFVEFSCAVRQEGEISLILDLQNDPVAEMVGYLFDNTVLHFHHIVTETDYSSALDYKNVSSLIARSSQHLATSNKSVSENPGIYFINKEVTIVADRTLPLRGSESSLARQSLVIIDQTRPNVEKVYSIPVEYTTCGDYLRIIVEYSQDMKIVQTNPKSKMADNTLALFLKPTSAALKTSYLNAYMVAIEGPKVIFEYYINAKMPVGSISLFSRSPLQLNGWSLVSKLNGITGPDIWDDSFLHEINLPLVRAMPVVKRVYSYNSSTTDTYSAGDMIYIFVEMSTGVKVKNEKATLELYIGGEIQEAVYVGMADQNKAIVFSYEVQGGDATDSLEYNGEYAFHGEVYQISSCEVPVPATMTLPPAYSANSLSTCCRIILASEMVYIESLIPIKGSGSYGENEEILIVARFSDKVVVRGEPYLLLDVGNGNVGRANYTSIEELMSSIEYDDLSIAFSAHDVVFRYIIQETDQIDSLVHAGVDALKVPKGSSILQYSNNPIFYVDSSLREPNDFSIVQGKVERQWKYRFPQKVEVLLRDIYHNDADSLTLTVEHRGNTGTIFSAKKDDYLGTMSKDGLFFATGSGSKGNNYLEGSDSMFSQLYSQQQGKGVTQDLFFSDSNLINMANKGVASQSSTVNDASCAIDGEYSPLIGDGYVSQTIREKNPWWLLTLPSTEDVVVQTIRIFERKPEQWITPMVDLIIKGLDRYPSGYFQLNFSHVDPKNDSVFAITDFIPFRASANEVKAAISAIFTVGNVDVVQTQLTLCDTGCGNGVDSGLGDKYQLTFTSIFVAEPIVTVTNIKYPGEKLYGVTPSRTEIQRFPIVWYTRTSRTGKYVTIAKEYVGSEVDLSQSNEWLTPFYVLIFSKESTRTPNDTTVNIPTGLNESIAKAFYYYRFDSIDTVLTIQLPRPIHDVYGIKIQREGYGILCLTEVEVFTEAINTFSYYKRGSPVQSFELMNPYTPEIPFSSMFNNLPYDGRWFFELSQEKDSTGFGQLSEIVVIVTDLAGMVHAYYQDILSLVTTMPRYGRLFSTTSGSYLSYPSSWQDSFGLVAAEQIKSKIDQMRPMGVCIGKVTDGECEWQAGGLRSAKPEIGLRLQGDIPYYMPLRSERVLYYVPDAYFTGYDYFTYNTYDRVRVASDVTVNLLVQPCRQFFNYSAGFFNTTSSRLLCDCMPSSTSILGDDIEQCEISRAKLCAQSYLRSHFLSMCSACYASEINLYDATSQQVISANIDNELVESTACRSETIRAVSVLRMRGICLNSAEMKDNGDSETLSVSTRAISDESLVCLKTKEAVTASSTMRRNYVPHQGFLFTRTKG